jgi:hypothetical protein
VIRTDRRAVLRLAGMAFAVPLIPVVPAAALSARLFAPPAGPMLYSRRLERELADRAHLVVSRSFAVRFVAEAFGFRVDGEQVEVEVDAPAPLDALARLERERVETGLFPLELDAEGAIRGVPHATASAQLDAAVREVAARIEQWDHTPVERDELRAFVNAVHQGAGELVTQLPRDLFAPVDFPREESRAIALPGGESGQVRTIFAAVRDPATGLMREARREVVTEVSGDVRRTVESWRLSPLA